MLWWNISMYDLVYKQYPSVSVTPINIPALAFSTDDWRKASKDMVGEVDLFSE